MTRDIRADIESTDAVKLDEIAKRVDQMERAIYGVSARDRRLVIIDEEARRLAPRYTGDPSEFPPGGLRLWHELLAAYRQPLGRPKKGAPRGGPAGALLAWAKGDGFFHTEMTLTDLRRTILEARR